MPTCKLTPKFCAEVPHPDAGQVLYFDTQSPRGFALRVTPGSKAFLLVYSVDGRQRRLKIGPQSDMPLSTARKKATSARGEVARGADPFADKRRARVEAQQRAQADRAAKEHTLSGLLAAYADALAESGKATTADAVRGMVRLHLETGKAQARIAALPAATVEPEDIVAVLSPLIRAGKNRTAGKLRSYIRAAYAAAKRSRLDAKGSPALRAFGLRMNPAADVAAVTEGNQARDRALSVAELRAYWKHAKSDPLLSLHLLTGAQRVEQLARATVEDLDADERTLRLLDPKGRRSKPRVHVVPMLPEAEAAIAALAGARRRGPFVFTATQGETPARYDTLRARLAVVVDAMRKADELEKGAFTPGDLRRTVETRLAGEGVGADVRARLQSHGLGGVQARHYDRHDYLDETRAALQTLLRVAEGTPANVTPIREARKGAK